MTDLRQQVKTDSTTLHRIVNSRSDLTMKERTMKGSGTHITRWMDSVPGNRPVANIHRYKDGETSYFVREDLI